LTNSPAENINPKKVINLLLEYGADPNIRLNRENDEMTVSMMLCNRIDNLQLADTNSRLLILLLSKGADITIRDSQGRTALHYAWGRKNSHLIDVIRSQTCDQIYVEALQSQLSGCPHHYHGFPKEVSSIMESQPSSSR